MAKREFDALVYIGRFQPLHNGHLAMLQQALQQADRLIVVLGSAGAARTARNPFSVAERTAMLRSALAEVAPERLNDLIVLGVRDYYDGPRWAAAVRAAVGVHTQPGERVGLFGHLKDASSAYLHDFPGWPLLAQANFGQLNAADLRQRWFDADGEVSGIAESLPACVAAQLQGFVQTAAFADVLAEYRHLQHYRHIWSAAPYPPVFITVDTVIECAGHVLLIQRNGQPGRGCWALPGGFLDQHERVFDAALRELAEETQLVLPRAELQQSLQGSALFDYPSRSARGRTVTHAFHFRLPQTECPPIHAADDAAAARWVPVGELLALETRMFEDHLAIIDHFLPVF